MSLKMTFGCYVLLTNFYYHVNQLTYRKIFSFQWIVNSHHFIDKFCSFGYNSFFLSLFIQVFWQVPSSDCLHVQRCRWLQDFEQPHMHVVMRSMFWRKQPELTELQQLWAKIVPKLLKEFFVKQMTRWK